jgi:hypothetical protein
MAFQDISMKQGGIAKRDISTIVDSPPEYQQVLLTETV